MTTFLLTQGQELPDWTFERLDSAGNIIDFTGHTFTLRVGSTSAGVLEKTSGISGVATSPNITVTFAVGDWDAVPPGLYSFSITPRRTSDSKDRQPIYGSVQVLAAIPAPTP